MRCLEPPTTLPTPATLSRAPAAAPRTPLCGVALAARAGDKRARDALAAQLVATLRPLVARHGRALGTADIDDLVQDLVVAAFEIDLARFDPARGTFLSFLAKRMRWRVADALRARHKRPAERLDDVDEANEPADPAAAPEERAARARQERALLALPRLVDRALADLRDPAARRALKRHDLDGVPLIDVARELGIHTSNACRARQRALAHLASTLAGHRLLAA